MKMFAHDYPHYLAFNGSAFNVKFAKYSRFFNQLCEFTSSSKHFQLLKKIPQSPLMKLVQIKDATSLLATPDNNKF